MNAIGGHFVARFLQFVADDAKTEPDFGFGLSPPFYAETGKKPRICSKWSPWSAGCGLPMKPTYAKTRAQIHRYYECPNHINRDKGCPTSNLPAEAIEMAVASNLASLSCNPAMMRVFQEHLPQLAHRRNSKSRLVLTQPEPPSLKRGNRPTKRAFELNFSPTIRSRHDRARVQFYETFITCVNYQQTDL